MRGPLVQARGELAAMHVGLPELLAAVVLFEAQSSDPAVRRDVQHVKWLLIQGCADALDKREYWVE